jgi:hypothetical protein
VPIQGNVSAARYRDEIMQPHLLPDIDVRGEIIVLQDSLYTSRK